MSTLGVFIRELEAIDLIDWRHQDGDGLDGTWVGSWPPHHRPDRCRSYRVQSRALRGGKRRLIATQRLQAAGWRQFGVAERTIAAGDAAALDAFFEEVATKAAHLVPAR